MADSSDGANSNQSSPKNQPQPAPQVRTAGPRVAPAATPPGGTAGTPGTPGTPGAPGSANPPQPAPRVAGAQGGFIVAPQPPAPQQQNVPPGYPNYPNYPHTPGYGVPQQGNTPPTQRQLSGQTPAMGTPGAPNYPNYPQQYQQNTPQQYAVSPQFVTPTYAPNAPSPYRQQPPPQAPRVGQAMPSPYQPAPYQGQPGAPYGQPRPYGAPMAAPMPMSPAAPVMPGGGVAAYELRNVHFRYPGAQFELYVPQLTIPAGKLVYIGGEAGCGKSTLMKLLALQTKPSVGDIWLLGMHTTSLLDSQLDDVRGGGIVYVPQGDLGLTDHVPVEGIKRLLHDFDGLPWHEAERRALMGLQAAQFPAARLNVKASNLSGGEKARVAIGKVYATQRPICLTDEVLGPLNERLRLKVVELFQQLADQGFTVICIEHQPQLQKYFDQVVILDQGRIESVVDTRKRPREKVPPTPPTP